VIPARFRQPGHAVVAVTQNLYPQTPVVLERRVWQEGKDQGSSKLRGRRKEEGAGWEGSD
jgi:hypothetical protein